MLTAVCSFLQTALCKGSIKYMQDIFIFEADIDINIGQWTNLKQCHLMVNNTKNIFDIVINVFPWGNNKNNLQNKLFSSLW